MLLFRLKKQNSKNVTDTTFKVNLGLFVINSILNEIYS